MHLNLSLFERLTQNSDIVTIYFYLAYDVELFLFLGSLDVARAQIQALEDHLRRHGITIRFSLIRS
jgi:hypothetical protein